MVGGAAALLSQRRRGAALAALLGTLVVYGAVASLLPTAPSGLDVAILSAAVLPAFTAALWLALPLARSPAVPLLGAALVSGLLAAGLVLLDVDSVANVAKLACFALAGYWFASLFEEAWWVTVVALLVPWVDIWSVVTGPTRYVVEEQPGFFREISVSFASPGDGGVVSIGPPDVLFFALFLAAAWRFGLRVTWTWVGMTALLGLTLVAVWTWEAVSGLPALPAVCLGFLLANPDLLYRDARDALRARNDPA